MQKFIQKLFMFGGKLLETLELQECKELSAHPLPRPPTGGGGKRQKKIKIVKSFSNEFTPVFLRLKKKYRLKKYTSLIL